jgi:Uma2 family endonuclease
MSPAPSDTHQKVSINLSTLLNIHLKREKCQVRHAPYDVRLIIPAETPISDKRRKTATTVSDEEIQTVVQPDICVICDSSKIDERGCMGAPDLIIEILSKGNNKEDTIEKFAIYEAAGVKEYWIIYPYEQSILIYLLNEHGKYISSNLYAPGSTIKSDLLPGLDIVVEQIFE